MAKPIRRDLIVALQLCYRELLQVTGDLAINLELRTRCATLATRVEALLLRNGTPL